MSDVPGPGAVQGTEPPRILLAEDDDISQAIIRPILTAIDPIDLTIVSDGRAAFELCMASTYDLLILDRQMPLIRGDKLTRQLRASPNPNFTTPIILFSASTSSELKDLGAICPADLILSKPIRSAEFLAAVRSFIAPTAKAAG